MFAKQTSILLSILGMLIIVPASPAMAQSSQPGAMTIRESDSLLNGALIGAGAGVASHLLVCRTMEPWDVCRNDFGPMLKFAALGAGIGAGVDALIRKKIYQSASGGTEVHAMPLIGQRTKGMRLSVTF